MKTKIVIIWELSKYDRFTFLNNNTEFWVLYKDNEVLEYQLFDSTGQIYQVYTNTNLFVKIKI